MEAMQFFMHLKINSTYPLKGHKVRDYETLAGRDNLKGVRKRSSTSK